MGRAVGCPFPKWAKTEITLPDEWLGIHAQRRDEAAQAGIKSGLSEKSATLFQFALSLALLDDWKGIPGLDGPPENWTFVDVPLEIIGWINVVCLGEFAACFEVPKKALSPSVSGKKVDQTAMIDQPGDLGNQTPDSR
ncbi:MAG TPA: hypothetical protein VMV52_08475 [Candidatus Nanopelagicaceae bacterium]|nr:hypothetical protein [Candidatus Nanopelagicaceae bacterium]